jgi:eukaryotic-like serine/threonine-protein kinase
LRINSLPWTHVSIDGRLMGTTPQRYIALAPGRHHVKLVNPELGLSKVLSIQIEPGQTLTKSVVLLE